MAKWEQDNIDMIREGNKNEFERLYNDFFDVLYAISMQYTADRTDAEGIVQDVFTKLWLGRTNLLPATNIRNYLYTLTKNLCLNHLRNKKRKFQITNPVFATEIDYSIESLNSIGDNIFEFEELKEKIELAIEKLPTELKTVFSMSRFDELKNREIADKLAISEKTVEGRMTKALKFLRTELKEYSAIFLLYF
jgi:RNA polymerase sigma-70 factor (ECF subfamily)